MGLAAMDDLDLRARRKLADSARQSLGGGKVRTLTVVDRQELEAGLQGPDAGEDRSHRMGQEHPVTVYTYICAGTIEDGAFLKKEWSTFERVVRTKVESLLLLCDSLREQRVRRIVLFSSLTSLLGNAGQADYGFANGFLDGFSKIASGMFPDQPIVSSMNWPYWEEGGMKISAEKLPAYVDNFLTQPLPTTIGRELLGRMLESDSIQAGVFFSNAQTEQVQAKLALKYLPDRAELAASPIVVQTPSATINDVHPEEKKREIQRYLFFFLESKLKLNLTENDLDLQFSELGVDSIAQMDFINKLEREKRFESIPQTLLVENTTVASLTEFFYEKHRHANYNFT